MLFPFFADAQGGDEPYNKEWIKADSLIDRGFPESAQKIGSGSGFLKQPTHHLTGAA